LYGEKAEEWTHNPEQKNDGENGEEPEERYQYENCFEKTGIGVKALCGLIVVGAFAEPAGAETGLEFAQKSLIGERSRDFCLAQMILLIAIGDGDLGYFAAQGLDGLEGVLAEILCGALFFILFV